MSSEKYIDNWETYAQPHDDKLKKYLETDDLTLKGKFAFLNKSLKLSGKTKINTGANGLANVADYTLSYTHCPLSSCFLTHKEKSVMFDGNFSVYNPKPTNVSLFTNLNFDRVKNVVDTKLALRYDHNVDTQATVGFEKFDLLNGRPDILTALVVKGGEVQPGVRAYGGYKLGVHLRDHSLPLHNFLFGLKERNFAAQLEILIGKNGKGEANNAANFRFNAKINSSFRLLGKMTYDIEKNETLPSFKTEVVGDYDLGDSTKFKARIANDQSLTMSLLHNYNKTVNFGFVTKFNLVSKTTAKAATAEIADPTSVTVRSLNTKFGLLVEFNDA